MKAKAKRRWLFPVCLGVYAAVFLCGIAWGLHRFWHYIDAYERSRPQIALDAYTQTLTPEYVCNASALLIAKIDHNLQSEEACRKVIENALQGELTCAKKSSLSTDTKQVYAILCGKQVIGTMQMEQRGKDAFGFSPWVVIEDSFDLSYLLTEPVSVTVPSDYPVSLWEKKLTPNYITENHIPYPSLKEYYEAYSLPFMVTYTVGPFLGQPKIHITDPNGIPVSIDKDTDMSIFLNNCSSAEIDALDSITNAFISHYVDFVSEKNNDTMNNYHRLTQYLVPNGDLAKRMYLALDGLNWVSDRGAVITSLDIHHYINIGDGRYLCDLTYKVTSKTYNGNSQTVNHVKMIYLNTVAGLKAETMINN